MSEKVLSVITVTYNHIDYVKNELRSLFAYNDIGNGLEVIIVDHSPVSIIPELSAEFPDVSYYQHENLGFGSGNNYGADHAHGRILCFLNPDTILIEPIFKYVTDYFEKEKNIGIVGTQLVDLSGNKNMSFYYIDRNSFLYKQIIKVANAAGTFHRGRMYISGANLFIRKGDFEKAGRFDENMFMYYEEPDLTKRVFESGQRSAFLKDAHIVHLEGKHSTPSLATAQRKYESAKYYSKKYSLDYRKILRQDYRYNVFKYLLKTAMGRSDASVYKEKCDYLKSLIQTEKNENEK